MNEVVFWGGTGQAKVMRDCVTRLGLKLIAVFDNDAAVEPPFPDVPLFFGRQGFDEWARGHNPTTHFCLVTIGGARGRERLEVQRFLQLRGLTVLTAVDPAAFVATDAVIGAGAQIHVGACVMAAARVGDACLINTHSSVDHDCVLGHGVHVAPGATLAGEVLVGDYAMIGAGSVVLPRIHIGSDALVGAGSVVTKDVPDAAVVYGNPARMHE